MMKAYPEISVFYGRPGDFLPSPTGGSGTHDPLSDSQISNDVLRSVLALTLGTDPLTLSFHLTGQGKPVIDPSSPAAGTLNFNLSHTRGLFLFAVSRDVEVGVDAEEIRQGRDFLSIARYAFTAAENLQLVSCPPVELPRLFTALWVRKEAVIKTLGESGARLLDRFEIPVTARRISQHTVRVESGDSEGSVTLRDLPAGPLHRAAVAWKHCATTPRISYRRIEPGSLPSI